jgi:hypothetical protein
MTFRPAFLFAVLVLFAAAGLPAAETPPAPQPLETAALADSWRTRLAALAAPRTLSAPFTETRASPLKKRPVVVEGTVRLARDRGLSLEYAQTRAPVVILDEKGLLLRHSDGREQAAPPEAEAGIRLLHALFVFDLATLEKVYALAGAENPDGTWTLVFTRRPGAEAYYRELTLAGDSGRLTRIELVRTERQSTVIALGAPKLDPVFTPEELARFFR